MMIVKKIAWLMVIALFCMVARIPDAAPLCSAGTEFIIDAMLGEANMPPPMPIMKSTTAKDR